jgi:deoxyribodipyrimidine photolyase
VLVWLRLDLRLADNPALHAAVTARARALAAFDEITQQRRD